MKAHVFPSFCVSLKTSMRSRTRVAGGFSRGVKKISNPLSSRNAALPPLSPLDQSLPATMTLLLRLVYSPAFIELLFDTVNEKKNFDVSFIFVHAGIRREGHYHSAPPPKKNAIIRPKLLKNSRMRLPSPSGGCQLRQIIENITIKLNGFMNPKEHVSLISFIIKIKAKMQKTETNLRMEIMT